MTEFGGGGGLGGGDLGGGGLIGGDLGGMSAPSFGPDPSVPSFTADPLGTPSLGPAGAGEFASTPPVTPTPTLGSGTGPGLFADTSTLGGGTATVGGIGPGTTTGVASPTTLQDLQAALPGAPFTTPSVSAPPPTPMAFIPPPSPPMASTPPPTTPTPAVDVTAPPAPDLGTSGLTPPTFAADPAVPSFTATTGSDGFTITPAAATAAVDTATGLTADTGTAGQGLASLALLPAAFGTFGAPVATAQTALQTRWGDAFTSLTGSLTSLFERVGTAIGNYLTGDSTVAAGFGGATPTPPAPTSPPQDKPLPPGGWDSWHLAADAKAVALLGGAEANFAYHGWWNAAGLVDHYLAGTGTDYQVDPAAMMHDIPTFKAQVAADVAAHAGQPTWQTPWQNTNTDLRDATGTYLGQQSSDWYWGLHDFRYRVYGTTDPTTGQGAYTVEVSKPYVFGSPRSDITVPAGSPIWAGEKIPQDQLQHLHEAGLAADFMVKGSATFPR